MNKLWHADEMPVRQSPATEYFDLGIYQRDVSTDSSDAQVWFNRGLIWAYAFNHLESAFCFEQAILFDPKCAMAYWGLAFALGPNYNKPWELFDGQDLSVSTTRAHVAMLEAQNQKDRASPVEKALIDALMQRYPQRQPCGDCATWNAQYAAAMTSVYQKFPEDLDVVALYVDSLMNLTPWQLWDLSTGLPSPQARTSEAKVALERILTQERALQHPGLLHLYIHLMEMSPTPELAIPTADYLRGLVPDAGHLEHMPSHLDILCGDYRRAIIANTSAIRADEKFLARRETGHFYNLYRCHDYHFRMYASMLSGQSKIAIDTANLLAESVSDDLLRVKSPPMGDWLEGFIGARVHALIRFGRWDSILALALPTDADLYCVTIAMIHYGRGIAYAATGCLKEAKREEVLFAAAHSRIPSSRTIFNNLCVDILGVAALMLRGEIAYRQGMYDEAFALLRRAVETDDNLPYDEPWGWMQPSRHALGALLLEQNRVQEAMDVYAADLGLDDSLPRALTHPNNIWSLHGYHECLVKMKKHAEAQAIQPHLRSAMAFADVSINSSCFCRLETDTSACIEQSL
ncbi:hypothetical protein POX_c03795 [Penicillium oxalicum]|uniref:hypothetical protein n=1 Tax=Penicillium oxalicum TaxID=69781 RepID=UPI0020B68845|nr:hypothetical protein POX_c03795 [Penicillium oxalicum]KAI2790943.1 hypothetical protein POX_c03795 [Penicillium oxalicum]